MRFSKVLFPFLIVGTGLFPISCKKRTQESTSSQTNAPTVGLVTLAPLELVGTYSTGINLGDADFVVIRDCDASGKTCKNDILSQDDVSLGTDDLISIDLKNNDTGYVQTITCKEKSKITDLSAIEQNISTDNDASHSVTDLKIKDTDYKCVVGKFPKSGLLNSVASSANLSSNTPSGTGLKLADDSNAVSTSVVTNSPLNSTQAAGIGAAGGFIIGFAAGFAIAKGVLNFQANKANAKYKAILGTGIDSQLDPVIKEKGSVFKEIVMTDFDGTQGLGDYDPHPKGYGSDLTHQLTKEEWDDFCKRKIGGDQGLREFRAKNPALAKLTPTEIIDAGHITELKGLKLTTPPRTLPTVQELVRDGHMVKLGKSYYNTPTFLEGSVKSLHGHIKAGRLVMFNSTNFRPNVSDLIEASLAQEMERRNLGAFTDGQNRMPTPEDTGFRSADSTSTRTRWRNVYIGTAAAIGVKPPGFASDQVNAVISGTKVKTSGDKTAIGQRMLQEAMVEDGIVIGKDAKMVSLDDKTGKGLHFAEIAADIKARHIFIQSSAVKMNGAPATDHIAASDEIFKPGAVDQFGKINPGETVHILDADGGAAKKSLLVNNKEAKLEPTKTTMTKERNLASHGDSMGKSMLSGLLIGGVLGVIGGVVGGVTAPSH